MAINSDLVFLATFLFIVIDIILIIRLLLNKAKAKEKTEQYEVQTKFYIRSLLGNNRQSLSTKRYKGLSPIRNIAVLEKESDSVTTQFDIERSIRKSSRGLHSVFKLKRIESAVRLGALPTDSARVALESALKKEKDIPVRLYLANALSDIGDERSIPVLVDSLLGTHRWYREKVNMLIADYGGGLQPYLSSYMKRQEIEIQELLVDCASEYVCSDLKRYLFQMIDNIDDVLPCLEATPDTKKCCCNCRWGRRTLTNGKRLCQYNGVVESDYHCRKYRYLIVNMNLPETYEKLVYRAAEVASKLYFLEMSQDQYVNSPHPDIRRFAVKALGHFDSMDHFVRIKELLNDEAVGQFALEALSNMISLNSAYIRPATDFFLQEERTSVKEHLAEALSGKVEYFILKLDTGEQKKAEEVIKQLIILGKTSVIIGFLNNNKEIELENRLVTIVKTAISGKENLEREFRTYLHQPILEKAGLEEYEEIQLDKTPKKDGKMSKALYSLLVLVVAFFPAVYLIRHFEMLSSWPILLHVKTYIIDFNYYLAFYAAVINAIYLGFALLSRFHVSLQERIWRCKSIRMLFKKKMLPTVSVIVPAFNEEKIIIESANSLLNLAYPDYELLVVNDGSKDHTLDVLIRYFDLKRVDYSYPKRLNTEPIRGIYKNPLYPKLIVVDKENGGKADSLNAGIVLSNKDYFCCIDSDSLLEKDALLKLASQTLDEGTETPALGGNIIPINGCKVERGFISEVKIPNNPIARFQTMEYIRAFMSGRLGWAYINCLLIISGAFGLFRKERAIAVGGYLTKKEKYRTDTVGEDMEVVVRISRMMREQGKKYRINYCYNANCWTEVPETMQSLKKQRYRWHRGLIEILYFHRKVLFNPRYGRMGMVSMPYFFIFELAGPLIEVQGYLMVIAAIFLGLFNWQIALLLLFTNILLGVSVSITSLIVTEKDNHYYSYGDVLKLAFCAVIENFGARQVLSFWRVFGYFKMFGKDQGWGSQVRKGFKQH
jgi:cellulose synthase/poly-beta-1,6-N-acetylglucosamine synthase-like glycosyltransferase